MYEQHARQVYRYIFSFLDKDGNDIIEQYRDNSVNQSCVGGTSTAEQFLLYMYIGIVAALGWIFIRYFLRNN